MTIRRSPRTRTAALLAGLAVAGAVTAAGPATASSAPAAEPGVSTDGLPWPAELREHTRLYVNPYRSYLVTVDDGRFTLRLSTGFDSCYALTQHGEIRYPC